MRQFFLNFKQLIDPLTEFYSGRERLKRSNFPEVNTYTWHKITTHFEVLDSNL